MKENWLTEEVTFYPLATDKYFQILQHFLQFITLGRWCVEFITKRITKKPFSRKITGWISSKPNLDFHNLKTVYICERLDWLYCVQLMHSRNVTMLPLWLAERKKNPFPKTVFGLGRGVTILRCFFACIIDIKTLSFYTSSRIPALSPGICIFISHSARLIPTSFLLGACMQKKNACLLGETNSSKEVFTAMKSHCCCPLFFSFVLYSSPPRSSIF